MKKVCSLIFLIVISIGICVHAVSNELVELRIDEENDEEIVVTFKACEELEKRISGVQGTLNFNKDNLELVDKKVLVDNFNLTSYNENNGVFLIELTGNDGFESNEKHIKPNQDILKLTFKKKNNSQSPQISIDSIILMDSNYESINAEDVRIGSIIEENTFNTIENDVELTNYNTIEEKTESKKIILIIIIGVIIVCIIFKKLKR